MKHAEGKFTGSNELNLYWQSWIPDGAPVAVLLVVHGLAEHSGRYTNPVNYFVPKGYAVYSFDLAGHGKSDGKRGYVERFTNYVDDVKTYYDIVKQQNKGTKIFLVGHSMGGTIATAYAIKHQDELNGLILSGAVLKAGASITKATMTMAKLLSVLLPKMGVSKLDASAVNRDKTEVDAYLRDPLNYTGKISARLGAELLNEIQSLPAQISKITLPILIMHGSADRLSDPASSKTLFDGGSSKDKTLKYYEGFYHEIFNDAQRQQVFADMEEWLKRHI